MLRKLFDRLKKHNKKIKITCLGGAGEIGMNLYVYETSKAAVVVDCGVMFGDSSMPGVDAVFPDLSYLKSIRKKIEAVIYTHGHEDHIGGMLRLIKLADVKVYAGRFTAELIDHKLNQTDKKAEIVVVHEGESFNFGNIEVSFISVPHSIPDTFALRISSEGFTAIHASDFRVDGNLAEICSGLSKQKVDCLLIDSTNASSKGENAREEDVKAELVKVFSEAEGRIFLTTFASNVERLASAVEAAKAVGRKIVVEGAAMERTIGIACKLGLMNLPESMLLTTKKAYYAEPSSVVYLVGGCQGEYTSTLYSIAMGERKAVRMLEGDLLIFSSRNIPGNEGNINAMVNAAMRRGVDVIHAKDRLVHVSGHAYSDELREIISHVKPEYLIPIHGEYQHMNHCAKTARQAGVPEDRCIFVESGEQIVFEDNKYTLKEDVPSGRIFVDYRGNFEMTEQDLSTRRKIARDGVVIVMLNPVSVYTYGFTLDKEQKNAVLKAIAGEFENENHDKLTRDELAIKAVKRYFRKFMDRRPLIDVITHGERK